tara:strand:+ start:729 stop:1238 length:510 start_codon:yes stop_codon:yes gene_type:complete
MYAILEKLERIEAKLSANPQYRNAQTSDDSSFEPLNFQYLDHLYKFMPGNNKFKVRGRNEINESWDYGTASIDPEGFLNIEYESGEREQFQTTPLKFNKLLIEIDRYTFIRSLGLYNDPKMDGDYSYLGTDQEALAGYVAFLPIFAQNYPIDQLIAEFHLASAGLVIGR